MDLSAKEMESNLILALDLPLDTNPPHLLSKSIKILDMVHPHICAVKINRHLVLPLELFNEVRKVVNFAHNLGLLVIMDCKINDIGYTNHVIAEFYYKVGFDALTVNPFVGWDGGLQPVFKIAHHMDRGVIPLVYMSHRGAEEGYGQTVLDARTGRLTPQYKVFAEKARLWNADGAVVGATYPEKIGEVKRILKDQVPIYSPGVGAQGGNIELAIRAGASYLIVGRSITLAENPTETAKSIKNISWRSVH
jgi:orotidine-5'-phosphate decarboxylase